MNNPTKILKVPEGLVRKANIKGIWPDILFFYQLKSLNIDGTIKKGNIESELSMKFQISKSSVWRKIGRLVKLGLLRVDKDCYKINKYDILFNLLGYNLKEKIYYRKDIKIVRKGNFKIFKISINNLGSFLEHIAYQEIQLSFQRQIFKSNRKSKLRNLIQKNKLNSTSNLGLFRDFSFIKDTLKEDYLLGKFLDQNNYSGITLSCSGVAKLLGYLSSSSGFFLEKKLEKLGLLRVENRKILLDVNPLTSSQFYFKMKKDITNLVLDDNSFLYYYLPNQLILLG